jgi:hypothetical protein
MMVMRSVGTVLIMGGSVVGRVRGGSVMGLVVVLGMQFLLHGFSTLTELSAFAAEVSASMEKVPQGSERLRTTRKPTAPRKVLRFMIEAQVSPVIERPAALTRNGGPPVGSARGMRRATGRLVRRRNAGAGLVALRQTFVRRCQHAYGA